MRPSAITAAVLLTLMSMSPVAAATHSPDRGAALPLAAEEEEGGVEESSQTVKDDLALVAEANGWTIEEANANHAAGDLIGAIAEQVARERPELYVGAGLADEPGDAPTLYIKGPADQFIRDLVAASDIKIVLADNQPYSFDELEARKLRVHHALEALGFRYVATSVNIAGAGVIPAGVALEEGLVSRATDILAALPADLRSSVQLTLHEAPNVVDLAAFGGMRVRDTGVGAGICTSGFSVRQLATGTLGISTAGHCNSMDQVTHPGHGNHVITFQGEHRGQWGDIEWHSTAEPEPDDFYSDPDIIRDVSAIEPRANIVLNESVCFFGRTSLDRDCSLQVADVSQSCTNAGVFNDRLVLMDGAGVAAGGDSGGPWFFGNKAYGSMKGFCQPNFPNQITFSVADLYDEAVGVVVTCGC